MGARVPFQRNVGAAQHHRWGAIAAHHVEGDRDAAVHCRWTRPVTATLGGCSRPRYDLAPIVIAAGRTEVMRPLQLAAIRAFAKCRRAQRMMRAAHLAPRRRRLLFWYGHNPLVKRLRRNAIT